ncbi:MAG: diguanylate cyclase [Acidobacteriaceae bacterium]|nr:diguanylate cyclase [Acidobacteriaceae bacterium]
MSTSNTVRPSRVFMNAVVKSSDSFYASLLDSLYDGVYFVDEERRITYWNLGAEFMTGYTAEEMLGRFCYDNLLMHVTEAGCALCADGCPLHQTLADGARREANVFLRHKKGHRVPVCVRVSPIENEEGVVIGAVEVFSDISAMKTLERKTGELENLAYCDALTGVANRRYLERKVIQAIQEVEEFDRVYGIVLVDVDEFKKVNDQYGHAVGDQALKTISEMLVRAVRPGDIVGRWGGDEFLLVARDVTEESLKMVANRCQMLIAESMMPVKDEMLRVTASLGATLLQKHESCEQAVSRADTLMYASKNDGRNRVHTG